jgi:carotenoid cleavage dioxygenase
MADTARTLAVTGSTAREVHPHLSGNLAPLRGELELELVVRGRIPEGLRGTLYRNGPNPQFDPGPTYHAFIGDGMIHAFELGADRAHYRNRWVRTPRWLAEHEAGHALFGGFGGVPDPSVANVKGGTANTNVVFHAGKLMALQEGSNPFQLDPATLASNGWVETGGRFTAHPKLDPETGELVWFAYSAGEEPLNPYLDYGVSDASGRIVRRDRFRAPYCSMVHDFLVTRNYVVFPVLPLVGDVERVKHGQFPFYWAPDKGAFLGVMKRGASVDTIRWIEIDPVYVFHPLNAWEDGSRFACEVMEYATAPIGGGKSSLDEGAFARLTRWTIDLDNPSARVKRELVDDLPGEFPRLDERFAGLPYRHGWFAANVDLEHGLVFDSLAHIDLKTRQRTVRRFTAGDTVSEPIFVPRTAAAPEGDGWILSVVHRAADDRSDLLVLNALDIAGEPEATLELASRVPAGFHGNWVDAR